ncbi:protein CutA homolog isoform X3 [Neodiprion virginianus]|uniref:protein CutA homolog isoform X3 n=1 Tax=Neodiprion virginianus TaxID=2961670 RepID=UPI001EE6EA08|nr:protein CutA homolog isoform X3 [Neodiprion virginianus]
MSHTSAVLKFLMLSAFVRNIRLLGCSTMNNISGIHSVAYVTVPSNEVAKNISRYEWKDEINEDQELLLMIKTRTEIVDALTKFVKENHPYEVCEVISLPIHNGNKQYLDWISETVPTIAQRESDKNS